MYRLFLIVIFLVLSGSGSGCKWPGTATGASAPHSAAQVTVRTLPYTFVAPESCARATGGWVVTDQGCGFEQPCQADKERRTGRVIRIDDVGTTAVLVDRLRAPNGVAVGPDGATWVVDKGEVLHITAVGDVTRLAIPEAKLLNDVALAGWAPHWVSYVSDTITGTIYTVAFDEATATLSVDTYAHVDGAPNGLAPSWTGDGVAVATLGDLAVPGLPGAVVQVDRKPTDFWHGGSQSTISPAGELGSGKLDGIVPFARRGTRGYLVSSIYDTRADRLDTRLWFVSPQEAPRVVVDLGKVQASDGSVARSAADIGVDPEHGEVCVPDLNGSAGKAGDGEAGAKVFVVSGL